jgi:phosphate transport system substrate-binding protein
MSEDWKSSVGANTALEWPVGIGAKGSEGVSANVGQTDGSIGYVEYSYAKQNNLTYARMINKEGQTVPPTAEAFQAAASNVDWSATKDFNVVLTNEPGAKTWPISGATFVLFHKNPKDSSAVAEALKFFDWAYAKGDGLAEELAYVPLPDSVVALIKKSWANITAGGKPVYAGM